MTDTPPRLVVDGLQKAFRKTIAVASVSFSIAPGERLAIIGPNGAGKSTTVKMITGQILPDAGAIHIDGHRIDDEPLLAKTLTGYVPQHLQLYPFLTGREVLEFVAGVREIVDPKARIDTLLARFALTDAQHRMTREYSDGMARKLSIACAIIGDPALLVLDESFAGLDPRATADVRAVVHERSTSGAAVLFVSHQLEAMERLCNRVLLIDGGRVTGTLDEDGLRRVRAQPDGLNGWYLERTTPT
jgi:ABC-2 type transport system ATP-binding protein